MAPRPKRRPSRAPPASWTAQFRVRLPDRHDLPTIYYLLPITYYLLPVTCYLLPITCYLLPVTCYLLPITCYLLPTVYYLLPISSAGMGELGLRSAGADQRRSAASAIGRIVA